MAEMLLDMEPSDMAASTSYLEVRRAGCTEIMGRRAGPLQLHVGTR
jgi:hypothetical protein